MRPQQLLPLVIASKIVLLLILTPILILTPTRMRFEALKAGRRVGWEVALGGGVGELLLLLPLRQLLQPLPPLLLVLVVVVVVVHLVVT